MGPCGLPNLPFWAFETFLFWGPFVPSEVLLAPWVPIRACGIERYTGLFGVYDARAAPTGSTYWYAPLRVKAPHLSLWAQKAIALCGAFMARALYLYFGPQMGPTWARNEKVQANKNLRERHLD